MFKKMLFVVAGLVVMTSARVADAQTVSLDFSDMVQNELAFQHQFYNWAWQGSLESARWHRLTGTPLPFDARTLYESGREAQQAWDGYIRQSQLNSDRTSGAIGRWTDGAIRGVGPYTDSDGGVVNLPWNHDHYHINEYGQYVPGYNPYRTNLTPYYGRYPCQRYCS